MLKICSLIFLLIITDAYGKVAKARLEVCEWKFCERLIFLGSNIDFLELP